MISRLQQSFGGGQRKNFTEPRNVRAELEKFYEKPVAKVSVELVLSIVAVVFFAFFALRPTLTTMAELNREIEDKRSVNEALSRKMAALATAQSEYLTYEERFGVLDDAVHEFPTLETALFYLEYLVRRENISLSGLRIETFPLNQVVSDSNGSATNSAALTARKEIGIYAINASFEGDYENILAFFQALEAVRPLFSVENFTFTLRTERDESMVLRVNVLLHMYGYESPQAGRALLQIQNALDSAVSGEGAYGSVI